MANDLLQGAYRGMADIAGLPIDTLLNILDLATAGVGVAGKELGILDQPPSLINRENIVLSSENIAKMAGIAPPTQTGVQAYNAARFATAAGLGGATGGVGQYLKQALGGGISGLTFTEAQKRYPDNPAIQMLGAMLPQVSSFAAKTAVKAGSVPAYISRISPDKAATTALGEDYKANLATLQREGLTSATRGMASGDTGSLAREQKMYINPASKNIPQAAMLKLAEQSKASVNKIVDKLEGISDTTAAGKAFSNAYNAHVEALINARRVQADLDFGAIQDKSTRNIQTDNVYQTIKTLIDEYRVGAPSVDGVVSKDLHSKVVSELSSLGKSLGFDFTPNPKMGTTEWSTFETLPKPNRNMSAQEAKARLEQYSGASVGKDKLFSDLEWRTQERRIAGMLSEALNKDLDVAAQSGIPDASRLKVARDNYAANSGVINDYAESTIGKFFNVDKEITGTEAYKKFVGLPKEQKIEVMQHLPEGVKSSLQKTAQTELMKKAESQFSVQKGKPTWDTEKWLKGLENMQRTGDYNILFSPEQRVALKNNIDALRMTLREGSVVSETQPISGAAMDIARASGGAKAGYIMQGVGDLLNYIQGLDTPTRASIMFSPLGESQVGKVFHKPQQGTVTAAAGIAQAADINQPIANKSIDTMSEDEIKALAEKEGYGKSIQSKSLDDMSDEEIQQLYQEEKSREVLNNPLLTEDAMRRSMGDPTLGEPISPEDIAAQQAADTGNKPLEITIIGGKRQ